MMGHWNSSGSPNGPGYNRHNIDKVQWWTGSVSATPLSMNQDTIPPMSDNVTNTCIHNGSQEMQQGCAYWCKMVVVSHDMPVTHLG